MYNNCTSILDTYTNTDQTVITGGTILFNTNRNRAGCSICHPAGSASIDLTRPGLYLVHFNGDAAESGTAGDITVQLFVNGVLLPGAEATEDSTAITDIVNLDFETTVRVRPDCGPCGNVNTSLTFVDTGVGAVFSNVEVVVTRIC